MEPTYQPLDSAEICVYWDNDTSCQLTGEQYLNGYKFNLETAKLPEYSLDHGWRLHEGHVKIKVTHPDYKPDSILYMAWWCGGANHDFYLIPK